MRNTSKNQCTAEPSLELMSDFKVPESFLMLQIQAVYGKGQQRDWIHLTKWVAEF